MTDKEQMLAEFKKKLITCTNATFDCGEHDGEDGEVYSGLVLRAADAKKDLIAFFKQILAATAPSAQGQGKVNERAEFEKRCNGSLKRHSIYVDQYEDLNVQDKWSLWLARAALRS